MKEGDTIQFTVENLIRIPGVHEQFYRLVSKVGKKYLMPAKYYSKYNIQLQRKISCRVDKINCSGKIFFEPEHPIYKQGEIYEFDFIKQSSRGNSYGEKENTFIVRDALGDEWHCPTNSHHVDENQGMKIKCKVLRIKKARIYLGLAELPRYQHHLQLQSYYSFKISKTEIFSDGQEYFILVDSHGNNHTLKKSWYDHYNLKLGQDIKCKVTKFISDGTLKLEPDHPYYRIGNVYDFECLRLDVKKELDGEESSILWLKDIYNQECRVKVESNKYDSKNIPQKISCKVKGFRKGTVLLSI